MFRQHHRVRRSVMVVKALLLSIEDVGQSTSQYLPRSSRTAWLRVGQSMCNAWIQRVDQEYQCFRSADHKLSTTFTTQTLVYVVRVLLIRRF